MGYIKSYFLNIIAVILFTVLVEILMPNSSFKGYIKLVLGLIVVLAVIKPVTNLADLDFTAFNAGDDLVITSSQIEDVQNNQINAVFCENLEKSIATEIENVFGENIDVMADADINEIRNITISGLSNEKKHEIISYISNTYGVTNVTVGGE